MLLSNPFFLSTLAYLSTSSLALPAPQGPQDCVVPEIAFIGLPSPFTLGLFGTGPPPLLLGLPRSQSPSGAGEQPFIISSGKSHKKAAQFRLTDGKLTTGGRNHDKFTAYIGPVPPFQDFPPYLNPLLFGNGGESVSWFGSYACDESGSVVTVLSPDTRE